MARETRWDARQRTLNRRNARRQKAARATATLDLDALAREFAGAGRVNR